MPDVREPRAETVDAQASRLERALANIWKAFLGVEVGRDDDFFKLGGASLEAIRMLAEVDEVLLTSVSYTDFVARPTVGGLAALVERARGRRPSPQSQPDDSQLDGIPCTPAQERIWFVEQFAGTGGYNLPLGFRIRSALDVDALEESLRDVVRRHDALRTTFTIVDGRPVQMVAEEQAIEIERHDLLGPDREREAGRAADAFAGRPFDLERGPLVRALVIRLGDEDFVFVLVCHHIVTDGVSNGVILRELAHTYTSRTAGRPSRLAKPRLQYLEYARRQLRNRSKETEDEQVANLRRRLEGAPTALDLPTDRRRPPTPSHRGAFRSTAIGTELSQTIDEFARAARVTPFVTVLAAFQALLHRYSGQQTLLVGSVTTGRERPEDEEGVGLYAKTIVLRSDVEGDTTFREHLRQTQEAVAEAVGNADAPFQRVVAEFQPTPDLSRHPLFQVFFAMTPRASLELDGVTPFHVDPGTARVDLGLWLEQMDDGYSLAWEYSTDLFDAESVQRIERHFLHLLRAALREQERSVGSLPLMTASERGDLLASLTGDTVDWSVRTLHEWFEAQVHETPDAVCVTSDSSNLSYSEVNARANRLAHRLRAAGIGQETLVALCLERSPDIVVATLAVLKAGGAYVPLDPEYPADRLAFVLADTGAPVILTQDRLVERLPPSAATVIRMDREPGLTAFSDRNPEPLAVPSSLAYVIYTSGSTGEPKGVAVEHRQVSRLVTTTEGLFRFGPDDTWLLFHSYAFDFSVWELWGALLHGARLVIAPHWTTRSPEALAELLAEQRITVFNVTPSVFLAVMGDLIRTADRLALRYVVFGGEALHPRRLQPWFDRFGDARPTLVNMYGITETTVHVTFRCLGATDCAADSSPIGKALPDLRAYVLDGALEPVPIGIAGELFIGGAGVARGYLNRPELTAERFPDNPFNTGRLYRTGDLARLRPDGELEYLGRIDDQVKIRGFRIELAEIAAVMSEHQGVAEASARTWEAAQGDLRIAAYAVPDAQTSAAVRTILKLLREGRVGEDELFELPNGAEIVHLNTAETEFLYEEIFGRGGYLKHGIEVPPDACVVDVGANIGMFSLLVAERAPEATILAFEPIAPVYEALRLNAEIHAPGVRSFNIALGGRTEEATFTYFPHITVVSGRHANVDEEASVIETMLRNTGAVESAEALDEMLRDRLEQQSVVCQVRRLSDVLAEEGTARVDLLKIDVEKSELDVLDGIDDADWPRIRQVVVEVHGGAGQLDAVTGRLDQQGFAVTVEEDELLRVSGLYTVYARRGPVAPAPEPPGRWSGRGTLSRGVLRHLEAKLPGFMIPSSLTFLEELPLTNNGKLDQSRLPPPERAERVRPLVPPRTPLEQAIGGIWRATLGLAEISTEDNFFHVGGHSLLASRVIAQVREQLGLSIPIRLLFEHPTLLDFTEQVGERAAAGDGAKPFDDRPVSGEPAAAPLGYSQEQILFLDTLEPTVPTYNGGVAFRVHGTFDVDAFAASLDGLMRRHEALRTRFALGDAGAEHLVTESRRADVVLIDLRGGSAGEREARLSAGLREQALRPFDLEHDPMLRATVFALDADDHVVLLLAHHIAVDGWSMDILLDDLTEFYDSAVSGRTPRLEPPAFQYRDFAAWQRTQSEGEAFAAGIAYWRNQLAGAPTVLALPTSRPRPGRQTFLGASHILNLPKERADAVRAMCRETGCTPYMLLLAVFATLLYRWTGQDDILVGTPFANRDRPEFQRVVGFLANTLVLRARMAGNPEFIVFLRQVRETVLAAQDHQHVPFGHVVEAMKPPRDPAFNPLFQVNFRVRVGKQAQLVLPGASTSPVRLDTGLARFDLALEIHVSDDEIDAEFIYNTDVFGDHVAQALAANFDRLLRQVLATPERRLLAFDLALEEADESPPIHRTSIRGAARPGHRSAPKPTR